jgi:hypothetical protein
MKAKLPLFIIPILFFAVLCFYISCNTNTKPKKTDKENKTHVQTEQTGQTGSIKVSKAEYDSTKVDVQHFIEELNQIIRKKDYNAWKAALSREYFAQIASPENLQQVSEMPAMKIRGITLKSVEDYFINVVVPSRANSRVDDIEFIGEHRVKAFTIMTTDSGEEQRLRLYDLEKTGNIWKIIN